MISVFFFVLLICLWAVSVPRLVGSRECRLLGTISYRRHALSTRINMVNDDNEFVHCIVLSPSAILFASAVGTV